MNRTCTYHMTPLPQKAPQIPLGEKTIVGRKTLSDLQIKSSQYKKKLSVSRQQAEIVTSDNAVMIEALGLNPMFITRKDGRELRLEKGHRTTLHSGDIFTLCGQHFPFLFGAVEMLQNLAPRGPDAAPNSTATPDKMEAASLRESNEYSPDFFERSKSNGDEALSTPMKREPEIARHGSFLSPKGHQDPNLRTEDDKVVLGAALTGKRIREYLSTDKYIPGTITAYRPETNEYEVTLDNGEVRWETTHLLVFVDKQEQTSEANKQDKKRKKERKKEKPEKIKKEEDGSRATRSSRKAARQVNYVEWESSSSGEDSERNYTTYHVSDKPKKPKNLTVVNPDKLSKKNTNILYSDVCLKHFVPKWHLEKPERLLCIMETLEALGKQFPQVVNIVNHFEPVTREALLMAHDEHYLDKLELNVPSTDQPEHVTQYTQELDDRGSQDFDTFMSRGSMEAAKVAAGAACAAVDMVVTGACRNAFCCVRPPGHHCGSVGHTEKAASQGYCIINNVAVAAIYARHKYGFKKIAVVDFDVHHGNGTEEILGGRDGFMFISIHVGAIYPRTGKEGKPRKPNVVCVSMDSYQGSSKFHSAFDTRIITALEDYKPDFLILSSGFDAHHKDPTEEGLRLEEKDYFILTEKLKKIAEKYSDGKLVSVLEGGYHLPSLKRCVREHIISLITE